MNEELKDKVVAEDVKPDEADISTEEVNETAAEQEEIDEVIESDSVQKELEDLRRQNQELTEKVASLTNAYAKAYADAENMKKRLERDFEQSNRYRIQSFASEILPVIDNCERALAIEGGDERYRKGFEMVFNSLISALKKEGVEEIVALNEPFDANLHQAMMVEQVEGVEAGKVTQVLQKGYKLKDRLLRAAMVKVSE